MNLTALQALWATYSGHQLHMLAAIEDLSTPRRRIVKMADDETRFKVMNRTNSSFRHDEFIIMGNEITNFVSRS